MWQQNIHPLVTAAHCLHKTSEDEWEVILGEHRPHSVDPGEQVVKVITVMISETQPAAMSMLIELECYYNDDMRDAPMSTWIELEWYHSDEIKDVAVSMLIELECSHSLPLLVPLIAKVGHTFIPC